MNINGINNRISITFLLKNLNHIKTYRHWKDTLPTNKQAKPNSPHIITYNNGGHRDQNRNLE